MLPEYVGLLLGEGGRTPLAEEQPLEHRLVDDAPGTLLVGADRDEVGVLDRWGDRVAVDLVEVDRAASLGRLGSERHEDEAQRAGRRHGSLIALAGLGIVGAVLYETNHALLACAQNESGGVAVGVRRDAVAAHGELGGDDEGRGA